MVFFGNQVSAGFWTNFLIDTLEIKLINEPTSLPTNTPVPTSTPTPTFVPTPSPTSIPRQKIVILPGFGASWNTKAIVYGTDVGGTWHMTPFVHEYDRLINSLVLIVAIKKTRICLYGTMIGEKKLQTMFLS